MRILAINLLRLGDVISTLPALSALRSKYPNSHITLLVNDSSRSVAGLMGPVDEVIEFNRNQLQKTICSAERPLLEPFDLFSAWLKTVDAQPYDLLINFTQNRLSGWLSGLINAHQKEGLIIDDQNRPQFGNPWFAALNQQIDSESSVSFNHVDIFLGAIGAWQDETSSALQSTEGPIPREGFKFDSLAFETDRGIREVAEHTQILRGREALKIAVQISTSDVKKEWGDQRFEQALRLLAQELNHSEDSLPLTVICLGSPAETNRVLGFIDRFQKETPKGMLLIPAIVSLEGALTLLEESDLLLTGDTSIKHLGAASSVPVVELALGSSDLFRWGSWKAGDVIISSNVSCFPCGMSEPCHRDSQLCATDLSPQLVVQTLLTRYRSGWLDQQQWQNALGPYMSGHSEVYYVDRTLGVSWPLAVRDELNGQKIGQLIDRSTRLLLTVLTDDSRRFGNQRILPIGTWIERLYHLTVKQYELDQFSNRIEFKQILDDIEERLQNIDGLLKGLNRSAPRDPQRVHEIQRSCFSVLRIIRKSGLFSFLSQPLAALVEYDPASPFIVLRKFEDGMLELQSRTQLAIKICRGLLIHAEELHSLRREKV